MLLENAPGVNLRYVKNPRELRNPDMIILPGTKNTMGDLKWLRQSGMEAKILKAHAGGCVVWGICGGYQMLGSRSVIRKAWKMAADERTRPFAGNDYIYHRKDQNKGEWNTPSCGRESEST